MKVKITAKRQVTFPARVLEALGVGPGDRLEVIESEEGFLLRPCRVDLSKLALLRDEIDRTRGPFDLAAFREEHIDPTLRD